MHSCFGQLDTLTASNSLGDWEALASDNGLYVSKVQHSGNLVVQRLATSDKWNSNSHTGITNGPFELRLKPNNELVILDKSDAVIWSSGTEINHPLSSTGYVKLQNDGKLIIYRGDGVPLWQNGHLLKGNILIS